MGASTFFTTANGESVEDAFSSAVREAELENGRGGYTGTIAEKREFVMITCPAGLDPIEYAEYLVSRSDKRINDKHGPAGCIIKGNGEYLFFGWAPE